MSTVALTPRGRPSRKSTGWTREKIAQLIQLYRQNECLWNYYNSGYKNKELRLKAVANICAKLKIDSNDYSKKIHNLRNQFNSEMKKLNRRNEETGVDSKALSAKGCRWEHFDALEFLRNVIEPRPGSFISTPYHSLSTSLKNESVYKETVEDDEDEKSIVDVIASEIESYDVDETTATLDTATTTTTTTTTGTTMMKEELMNNSTNFKEEHLTAVVITSTENNNDCTQLNNQLVKRRRRRKLEYSEDPQQKHQQHQQSEQQLNNFEHTQLPTNCSILEVASFPNANSKSIKSTLMDKQILTQNANCAQRDEWNSFGELVANEFRQLNSDDSRKKLKRKIMRAILEVGEEDDV